MPIQRALAVVSFFVLSLAVSAAHAQAQKPPAAPPKPAGSVLHDFVMLKDGTSINGDVMVDTWTLKMKYGTLTFKKNDILAIEYKKPPNLMEDEVQVSAGTRLRGDLLPTPVKIKIENNGTVDIPKSDILSIMIMRPIEELSEATKKALGRTAPKK